MTTTRRDCKLLLSLPDQSPSFVHGFEAGVLWQALSLGRAEDGAHLLLHEENEEVFRRIARHYGWAISFERKGNGQTNATITRGRPALRMVEPAKRKR